MILSEIVNSAMGCFNFRAYHASFLLTLCAVDATAQKRYTNERSVGTRFKSFLREYMPQICRVKNFWVAVDMPKDDSILEKDKDGVPIVPKVGDDFYKNCGQPRMVLLEGVLYHAFRCALSHEAQLHEVELLPPSGTGFSVRVDSKVRLSADFIPTILNVVINAPENRDSFPQSVSEKPDSKPGTIPQEQ